MKNLLEFPKNLKNKPLAKLISATEYVNKQKLNTSKKLTKLLQRLDLDRPLLLKEKLDIFW